MRLRFFDAVEANYDRALRRISSEQLAILDEAGAVRQRVVEAARNGVGLVREPMNAACAGRARGLVYCLDQRAAQPELARALGHEQILQIAVVADRPAGAVIDVVHDAEKLAVDGAAKQPHRLLRIVQPRPGRVVGLLRHRHPVEIEVALPQRLPGRALVEAQRADRNLRGHGKNSLRTSPKIAIIRSISCRVTVSAGMKRNVSVRGALSKSPHCSANPTTCGPISLRRFSARSKPRPRTSPHWYCCDSSVSRLARCAPASTTPARKPGLAISSKTAHPTAVANALPLNVPPWSPCAKQQTSLCATSAPSGMPPPSPLARTITSGSTPAC